MKVTLDDSIKKDGSPRREVICWPDFRVEVER